MHFGRLHYALLCILLLAAPLPASADRRVALVIGNNAYKHSAELKNPKNDAEDISTALKSLQFEVIVAFDLEKADIDHRILAFSEALVGADVGIFFYAGHGLQVAGRNYIVPVDAKLTTAAGLDFEMVPL